MADLLMQLTIYNDGTVVLQGPKQPDDLGELLRTLAEAADNDGITWTVTTGAAPEQ